MLRSTLRFTADAFAIGGQLSFSDTRRFSVLFVAERLLERDARSSSALEFYEFLPIETTGLALGSFIEMLCGLKPITPKSWFSLYLGYEEL